MGIRALAGFTSLALIFPACGAERAGRSATPTPSLPPSPQASPTPDEPDLREIGSFEAPIHLASPPKDERLFIVERAGVIRIISAGKPLAEPALDIREMVSSGGERGLFMLAFAPDYAKSGLAYVHFTDRNGDTRVFEFKVSRDPNKFDKGSGREILRQQQPFPNHNGGPLLFDPSGMLILALGDGGSGGDPGNRAQNLGTWLGKLVRVDPRKPSGGKPYGIPTDNPFVNRAGALPEIWAYGLRNPWRMSFEPKTRDLYIGDVGQGKFEEIDWVPSAKQPGANYGWRAYEGLSRFSEDRIDESRLITPVLTYKLGSGNCAVTGGVVYRGEVNTLQGFYLYADFCQGQIKAFRIQDGRVADERDLPFKVPQPASFAEDSSGQTYVISLEGKVYKIVKRA